MAQNRKAILITRQTRYQELVAQYNTESQAAFVIESRGQDFEDYKAEHAVYQQAITEVENTLQTILRVQQLDREFLPNFLFGPDDLVIVVGQDGLVANTLKYLNGQPVIAINPEPKRYDGILLPFAVKDTELITNDVLANNFNAKAITMAKATLNDGQEITAVNELFIGPKLQISARYEIEYNGKTELQSSSGLIVSTGLGSTGWLTSIMQGAEKIAGINKAKRKPSPNFGWEWDRKELRFAVREPFPSHITGTDLVYGDVTETKALTIKSQMANHGVIFSDGMVDDFIEFNSGTVVEMGFAKDKGVLVF